MMNGDSGGVTVSRAFGDFAFKPSSSESDLRQEDVLTSVPEVSLKM